MSTRLAEARAALAAALDELGSLPLRTPLLAALDEPVHGRRDPRDRSGG